MPFCPTCHKVKLVRCKILRTADPDYGREYVACPACSSRWFLDDPNKPPGLVSDKPKQSIWKKLATFGSPHNVPDSHGILHPATYVFPPAHEYPSLIVPIIPLLVPPLPTTSSPDPSPVSPAAGLSDIDLLPPPEPEPEPLPPAEEVAPPERALDEPAEAGDQTEPPVEQPPPSEKADQPPEPASEQTQTTAEEPSPAAPEQSAPQSNPDQAVSGPGTPQQSQEQRPPPQTPHLDSEEQARFDLLSRIASSPAPTSRIPHQPSHPQSILDDEYPLSLPSKTPSGPLSPEEQHLRETLLRVTATPRSPTPKVYTTLLSPKIAPQEFISASSPAEEREVAAYAQHIAARLDEAILKSPFISKQTLKTPQTGKLLDSPGFSEPRTPASKHSAEAFQKSPFISKQTPKTPQTGKWLDSPRFSEPRTPALKHSAAHSPRHHSTSRAGSPRQSIVESVSGTHRSATKPSKAGSARSTSQTPRASYHDVDEVPLPGAFPTPKPTPLTPDAVNRLPSGRPSPYSTSLKSAATSASLPIAPSHHTGSNAGGRTPKRVSIAADDKSPLWG